MDFKFFHGQGNRNGRWALERCWCALRSQWGFVGWGLEGGWWQLGFFPWKIWAKLFLSPSTHCFPSLIPWAPLLVAVGPWVLLNQVRSDLPPQRRDLLTPWANGKGAKKWLQGQGLSLGAELSTAPLQTFIRVHRVNWNIPAPTALIHSESLTSFW